MARPKEEKKEKEGKVLIARRTDMTVENVPAVTRNRFWREANA
jgi:hypothetical protein